MAVQLPALNFLRATVALVTLLAIGWQLALHVGATYSALNFFSYFTNLSNLFALIVLLSVVFLGDYGSREFARYLSAVKMAVVGLVFSVLLRNADLGALLPWVNVILHYVTPLAVVVDWVVAPPTRRLNPAHAFLTLIFPAVYLAYVLIRGASTGWYPYPFLNPQNVSGYGAVAAYSAGIAGTFLLVSGALLVVGNNMARSRSI